MLGFPLPVFPEKVIKAIKCGDAGLWLALFVFCLESGNNINMYLPFFILPVDYVR